MSKSVTFYTHKMCPYAQRVWIGLNLAGQPYDLEQIDLYGVKPKWFLQMNPKGLVPVLKHGDDVITESEVILDYIASEKYCEDSLLISNNPEDESWWRNVINSEIAPIGKRAVFAHAMSKDLENALTTMDSRVRGPFLCGNKPCVADASVFPFLYRLNDEFDLQPSKYPALKLWLSTMLSVDAVRSTVVSSWWWWW